LTCTVLAGPRDDGRYFVELSLDEGEQSKLCVRPERLTLRLRRAALSELAAAPPASDAAVAAWSGDGAAIAWRGAEVVDESPRRDADRPMGRPRAARAGAGSASGVGGAARPDGGGYPSIAASAAEEEPAALIRARAKPARVSAAAAAALGAPPAAGRAAARAVAAPVAAAGLAAFSGPQVAASSARDLKFEALDSELAQCCADDARGIGGPLAARLGGPAGSPRHPAAPLGGGFDAACGGGMRPRPTGTATAVTAVAPAKTQQRPRRSRRSKSRGQGEERLA